MEQFDFIDRIFQNLSLDQERKAFYIRETWFSYGELASVVAEIQSQLSASSVGDDHVGIYLEDDIYTYASILALWMTGKAFVPVNPKFPLARNRKIMEQMEMKLLLHSLQIPDELMIPGCKRLATARKHLPSGRFPVLHDFDREKDAYLMFTSGSTGDPKGVRISFANLNSFIRDFIDYQAYAFIPDDRFLQIYDLSFDASVHCYVVPLVVGASVFTVPPDRIKYLAAFKLMKEKELTFVKMPPSTLSYLRNYFSSVHLPALKYLLLGGEAFPVQLVEEFESSVPNALIQNVYGPTEVTINCLIYDWNAPGSGRKRHNGIASIGRGFGTNRLMVLADNQQSATPGEVGELLVAGEQVSPGYWKDMNLNKRAFLTVVQEGINCRYYRTGDLVFMDDEGDMLFLGRNDEQIQVRGYRVELGEIESLAREWLGGINVVATGIEKEAGEMKIFLFIESVDADTLQLREHLSEHLPPYMIPDEIVDLKSFPRLVSGKTDKKALIERFSL
jgi:D-alanine--poly(phosphoribitol) ligase subunit 1